MSEHFHDSEEPKAPHLDGDPEPAPMSDERRDLASRLAIKPGLRHAVVTQRSACRTLGGGEWDGILPTDALGIISDRAKQVKEGDMAPAIGVLMAQAMTLDTLFTELAAKAGDNMDKYPQAVERYLRLALKAQANSRTTIEAMAKIARGGEQVVRHIHVDNRGGQAVIAETIQTGGQNALSTDQPHAFEVEREIQLRSEDALGIALPEQTDAERPLPDARREIPWGAEGEPERLEARGPFT